jgi:hypothetical protein
MYEIRTHGVVNLPKSLAGTDAERLAYDTSNLAAGSIWKVIDSTTHKVTAMWEWDGEANWNHIF